MNAIHTTATLATGSDRAPRWNGPRTNRGAYATRSAIGTPYEMYSPMVAIDVAAEKATALPRLGRPRMKLSAQASQTTQAGGNEKVGTKKGTRTDLCE